MRLFSSILVLEASKPVKLTPKIINDFASHIKDAPNTFIVVLKQMAAKNILSKDLVDKIYNATSSKNIAQMANALNEDPKFVGDLHDALRKLGEYYRILPHFLNQETVDAVGTGKINVEDLLLDTKTTKGKNAIAKKYMPILYKIVNQYVGQSNLSKSDLISVAMEGMTNAIEKWSLTPDKDGKVVGFKTLLAYYVKFAITNEINANGHTFSGTNYYAVQKHGASSLDAISLDNLLPTKDGEYSQDHLAALGVDDQSTDKDKELEELYKILDKNFSARDCNIFYRFFGLNGYKKEKSKDIAKEYGMSEGNIRNSILNKMIKWIKGNKKVMDILYTLQELYTESLMCQLFGASREVIVESLESDDTFILMESVTPWKNKQQFMTPFTTIMDKFESGDKELLYRIIEGTYTDIDTNFKKHKDVIVSFLSEMYPTEDMYNKTDIYLIEKMSEIQTQYQKYN